jgi:hypothetical protein
VAGFLRRSPATPEVPLPNSYWVLPGRFLAGEHPQGDDEAQTRERLAALQSAGIDYFLDLTEAHELAPYQLLLPRDALYRRCAIPDMEVPEEATQMCAIQTQIRDALRSGRGAYVHCRAGIGRTGMVVGCYLAETGLDGKAALKRLNVLWRQSARAKTWRKVPQTLQQAYYIESWTRGAATLSPSVDS